MEAESILVQTSTQLDDEAQLVLLAKTDDQAFERLYNHYFDRVYGYVFKRVGQKEAAEDIVSTAFLKIFTNLDKYQPGKYQASFCAWIFRIVTNTLIDYYRKNNKPHINIDDIAEPIDHGQDNLAQAVLSDDQQAVHRTIEKMSPKYQKIIQLKFFAELSNLEIAEVMEISVSNAGVLLHRALKKFQDLHQKYV